MSLPRLPRTIACIGRNYADHIKELGNARPKEPFFFLKPPGSLLYRHQGPILVPKGVNNLHFEVELGVILADKVDEWKGGRSDLTDKIIKGWCVGIDMTARNCMLFSNRELGVNWG